MNEQPSLVPYRRAYPLKEAAVLLGVGLSTLKNYLADGTVRFVRLGGRRKITEDEIRRVTTPRHSRKSAEVPDLRPALPPPSAKEGAARLRATKL